MLCTLHLSLKNHSIYSFYLNCFCISNGNENKRNERIVVAEFRNFLIDLVIQVTRLDKTTHKVKPKLMF